MQTTSATWAALYAAGAPLEVRVEIGGTVYTETSAPVISRAAMQDRLSVGNVVSAALLLFVRTNAAIARSAEVAVSVRLNDGETASEWLPAGTFYISRRARDPVTGLLALECYDALLKANAVWEPSSGTWPRTMENVVTEFLTLLGVSLDSRTVIPSGAAFVVSEPAEGTTIRDVLGMIGQAGGGNWIITPENKLRLVPLVSAADAAEAEDDAVDVAGVVGNIDVSGGGTITGVRDTWEGEVTLTGTDSGIVVDVSLPPLTAAEMSDAVLGQSYQAYSLTGAVYDPATELGDYVRAGANGEIASVLYSERVTLAPAFRGDIGAPEAGELSDEYPYIGANARTLALARASIQQAVETLDDELDQQEIFNRLTDNGAAQGLVLYNGQLYINASYINAGTISADRINLNTYNPDFLIPDENDSSTLLPGQSISNGWVVQSSSNITVLKIPNAEKYQGKTIEISATSQNFVSNGTEGWYTQDSSDPGALPEEHASAWYAPTYGTVSSDGTLTGATKQGSYYKYTRQFTIPNDAVDAYTVAFGCSGVKAITVSTGVSSKLGLRYAQNISIDNTGLQVGKFVVNRSGDATFNGNVAFNGGISGIPAGVKGNAESSYRTGNVNLTPGNIGAVALSGDTMTGRLKFNTNNAIAYQGTKAWYDMIKFKDNTNDEYGNGIVIGGGGATIIGGGESADTASAQVSTGGSEILYLCNDGDVNVYTNMQDGWASRKTFTFGANGTLTAPAFSGPLTGNVTGNAANVTGTVAIGHGGTGATTAANARSNLGIVSAYDSIVSKVYFDNTNHAATIVSGSYVDFNYDLYSDIGLPANSRLLGFTVLCDRNAYIIVAMVSASGTTVTFRFYNPSRSSQATGGVVCIALAVKQ